jgi:hypothetical protein
MFALCFCLFVVEEGRRKKKSELSRRWEPELKQTVGATSRPRRGKARHSEGLQAHARGLCDHEDNEAGGAE